MKTHHLLAKLFVSFLILIGFVANADSIPKVINYQGKLVQANGIDPLVNGTYVLRFELFDAKATGNLVGGESRQVIVLGGIFNVILGAQGAAPVAGAAVNDLGFAFGSAERFLQTTIVSGPDGAMNQVLAPRQQLVSVPYALAAQAAGRAEVAKLAESLIPELTKALNPPGTIIAYAGAVADVNVLAEPVPGYLLCNGAVVDATVEGGKYAALKAAVDTAWGNGGDGNTTTVNLPDLRGVFLRGWSGSNVDIFTDPERNARVARKSGGNIGNLVGSYQMDGLMSHTHTMTYKDTGPDVAGDAAWTFDSSPSQPDSYEASKQTGSSGGPETRAKNANVVYLIKY